MTVTSALSDPDLISPTGSHDEPDIAARRLPLAIIPRILGAIWDFFFGVGFLIVLLAVLAAIPILQMMSLGYLLEVCGRVARSGRLRDGFVGIRKAARLGTALSGTIVSLSPLFLIKYWGYIANLVNEGGKSAVGFRIAFVVMAVLLGLHVVMALFAGGRLRHFLWPLWLPLVPILAWIIRKPMREWFPPLKFFHAIRHGYLYRESRDAFWTTLTGLRLPYYFWLGLRGFIGGVIWLFLPVAMLVFAVEHPQGIGPLVGFLGTILFMIVLLYLPFVQTRFAAERRWKTMFEVRAVREQFARAPLAFLLALLVTLALATPLYLLKIEATPQEIAWLPAIIFVAFTFPSRLITGWAVGRGIKRSTKRHWFFRWVCRLLMLPAAASYVLIVLLTQYSSWNGTWSLLEQHAFLLPVPFLGAK